MDMTIALIVGLALGGGLAYWMQALRLRESIRSKEVLDSDLIASREREGVLATRVAGLEAENSLLANRLAETEKALTRLQDELETVSREAAQMAERASRLPQLDELCGKLGAERDRLQSERAELSARIAELTAKLDAECRQSQEKLALVTEAREQDRAQLAQQFKLLANEILEEKSRKFTEQNQANLGQLLDPLREKIVAFQAKVEEVYVTEGKDRSALAKQVELLTQLNNTLSQDTQNLTLALKGDRKAQGNLGEIILDDVLEKAGLRSGEHYVRQGGMKDGAGQTVIPDVVIRLPGDRHLVVDSKMTLPDYRAFANADGDDERGAALKRHLLSIRNHIKGLSEKNYQALYGLSSLDFVVMFVPLEPAFTLAVSNDAELFQFAWERNVLLVSPSTLLFVVRTVAYLWRQEGLSRNAQEISRRGAELYDKLVGFIGDLEKVGERLDQAKTSYQDARRKFSEGPGNLVRQAEMLKGLGVKPSKAIDAKWLGDPAAADDR